MTWFKEIPMPLNNDEHWNAEDVNFLIKPLEQTTPQKSTDITNDLILQWVIAPFVVSKGVVYRIHAHDSELVEYTSTILTNLFNSVRGVYVEGELVEIRLEELKQHAHHSFTELVKDGDKIDPLVKDFYLKENVELSNQLDIKLFKIDIDKFIDQTTYHTETDHFRLWEFLMKSNALTLLPTNWVFNDRLLESPFLLFLSRYANEVVLTVNYNDLNVRAISFKGNHQ